MAGVDPDDTADPAATLAALDAAQFVVSLEVLPSAVTERADVVFPVAPVTEKEGTFVNWEGRTRPFGKVVANPNALPDLRVLSGIAEELAALGHGKGLGFRTVAEARERMQEMGPWDGDRPELTEPAAPTTKAASAKGVALATWKQMLDNGTLQRGDEALRATARMPVARVSQTVYDALGPAVTLTGDRGSVTLPAEVTDIADDTVWVPANSFGRGVLADLASPGSTVTVKGSSSVQQDAGTTKGGDE